jgi:hypothetical protein
VKLGTENRKQTILAAVLGVVLLLIVAYWFLPSFSTNASTTRVTSTTEPADLTQPSSTSAARPAARRTAGSTSGKKERPPQSLDPTLHLDQLASTEQIKYEGSGRNIFISQADTEIPKPQGNGTTDKKDKDKKDAIIQIQAAPPPPAIPLKFFGFASHSGEAKKIFLSKGLDDVFIAGEGEIVDRRYKVVRISSTSVEMQDLVVSGPPQSIPLTQEKP